jgi:predicted nucleotide-binding protein (sugar kinase/HSP70/actin superfamily)
MSTTKELLNEIKDLVLHPVIKINSGDPKTSQVIKNLRTQLEVAEDYQRKAWNKTYELETEVSRLKSELLGYKQEEKDRLKQNEATLPRKRRKQKR